MKTINKKLTKYFALILLTLLVVGCERNLDDLSPASYPANPDIFIDGFSAGLNYASFGGAVPTAFDVDQEVTFDGTAASMRFEVPDAGDPRGAYAGGAYYTDTPRDLSGYNALTFWAKASQAANIDVIGFGNDMGESRFQVTVEGLAVNTNWKKYIIPVPDPSRLTAERGMFFYSEGPENEKGYTFWIDEVKFENLGTIAHPQFTILNGESQTDISFIGVTKNISDLRAYYNLPTGVNQEIMLATSYYSFQSSDVNIATVSDEGVVTVVGGPGEAEITATVSGVAAEGKLTIESIGDFVLAPIPDKDPADVISLFSDAYDNVPVNYYNGYWEPYQTTLSADFEVNGDHILHYTDFNFVGIEFSSPTIDASQMSHIHLDIYLPNALPGDAQLQFELVNEGTEGSALYSRTIPMEQAQQWISLDIAFADFSGLNDRSKLMQLIFVNENGNMSSFYADNIFFYNDGTPPPPPSEPETAAPVPTVNASDVSAVFSDSYTVIAGTNLNPAWGQATVVSEIQIEGNNTLKYAGLNYQGIELGSSQNLSAMTHLHLDFWSANSTSVMVFLISPGPIETPYTLTVPTTGWSSIDIPLSEFAPVDMGDVIQLKFEGNGDIYLDNIYFRK
ncbi:MAG: glycosyl hydrolase family 16 [Bacteroidetes bacterium]|nr:glycosyl hydrolase family 16 [Bacteroidota bacterium]MBU1580505.1 glycosyl hydrolase family 16 [Bacteroidota bacterium]MBU2466491.1 glycosyl hydrolase family 16 [Bacteroidota bacterium]MBU2557934.1 glycosyl hydrolase family 16 [Bacteroidota bacterium]